MTSTTTNLGLITYNNSGDQSGSFLTWTQDMSGSSNSNMTKIDSFAGGLSASVVNLSGSVSGSITNISGSLASVSGSLVTLTTSVTELGLRFVKIGEFSGAGQADFTSISGSYTHLLIIGVASVNVSGIAMSLGMDFNGDSTTANYDTNAWYQRTDAGNAIEYAATNLNGCIRLGEAGGNGAGTTTGATFMALIPNYSGSAGFYKNSLSVSNWISSGSYCASSLGGGVWKSVAPITQIRIFGIKDSSARQNFNAGTKISLYGLG